MTTWTVEPASAPLTGDLRVPSDKSITHRSVMLGGLAAGTTIIKNPLLGHDAKSTMVAMTAMGAKLQEFQDLIEITGAPQLNTPATTIDCGNAGTLMRLLAGAICGRNISCVLDGDVSLRRRPMLRISEPLQQMGAQITTTDEGTPPLNIEAVAGLNRIEYTLKTASAQVKSAVLLAGLTATGGAKVVEPQPCRNHTELMLPAFGAQIKRTGQTIEVNQCDQLHAATIAVPADISSAAFFLVAASIVPGSELLLREVCVNPTRIGIITILRKMGAAIELVNERMLGLEPVADLRVRHAPLCGYEINAADVPAAIDELPVVFVAASLAKGTTTLRGAAELRAKESDRLATMAQALSTLGIKVMEYPDGLEISGGSIKGGSVDSHGDHRIAMALAVAGLRSTNEITIDNCANVATSFPGFANLAAKANWNVSEH